MQVNKPVQCTFVTYMKDNNQFDTDVVVGSVHNVGAQGEPRKHAILNVKRMVSCM